MKEINLNQDLYIDIEKLNVGTNDMKVKISRNYYFIRITKNKINSYIEIKVPDGKFKSRLGRAFIKNDVRVEKDFILNIREIEAAQETVKKYNHILDKEYIF